jgi:hypothetical protein
MCQFLVELLSKMLGAKVLVYNTACKKKGTGQLLEWREHVSVDHKKMARKVSDRNSLNTREKEIADTLLNTSVNINHLSAYLTTSTQSIGEWIIKTIEDRRQPTNNALNFQR